MRRFRYSERRRLQETGSLGDLVESEVPQPLRNAVDYHLATKAPKADWVKLRFHVGVTDACLPYFGWPRGTPWTHGVNEPLEDFLDWIEVVVEEGSKPHQFPRREPQAAYPGIEQDLNALFERHRFGYRIQDRQVHAVRSPRLDEEVIGPALFAVTKKGWNQVEEAYRRALDHERAGEVDDALTAANAAVESALKAFGCRGRSLGPLLKDLRRKKALAGYAEGTADELAALLGRLMRWRSTEGDAHGKAPGAQDPPPALASLAIHWAGAFIVYLHDVNPDPNPPA
jgi:hypothetical protein